MSSSTEKQDNTSGLKQDNTSGFSVEEDILILLSGAKQLDIQEKTL